MAGIGRPKGGEKKGGRVKGTPNKTTKELRQRINDFIEGNFEEAVAAWRCIPEPDKKIRAYVDLCAFVLPKLQSVQMEANINKASSIEEDLKALSNL